MTLRDFLPDTLSSDTDFAFAYNLAISHCEQMVKLAESMNFTLERTGPVREEAAP